METAGMSDVYEKLRQRLDDMGTGFPATRNGIEIKILRKIFTEADAEMFLLTRRSPGMWKSITMPPSGRALQPSVPPL